ncbi:MAG TPA: sulfotransferase [Phycisphaerales bacterium]|nr:sulfotransferase [Phycisphaerales bacterium]
MKCATSTLAKQLGSQPGVFMCEPKEPNYFSNDEIFANGPDWYESLFEPGREAKIIGEASTHYTKLPTYPQTVDRFRAVLPDAKLIYVMRHPIDRLVSQYVHEWTQRVVTGPIEDELDANPWMLEYGRYAMQLEPWLEAFGPDRILPVFSERLREDPQSELSRVGAFLGYEGEMRWVDAGAQNVSAERMRKSPVRDAVLDLPGLKQIRRRLVPQGWRDRIKGLWRLDSKPELSPARAQSLEMFYDADLKRLGELLGVELNCANFKSIVRERPLDWASSGSSA